MEECPKCRKSCEIQQTEILPDGGILEMAIHNDGTKHCKWPTYDSFEALERFNDKEHKKEERKQRKTQIMKCPRCGKMGSINLHHHEAKTRKLKNGKKVATTKSEDQFRIDARYYIYHKVDENIPPEERKKILNKGDNRCENLTPAEREKVLKKLGRYISTPKD